MTAGAAGPCCAPSRTIAACSAPTPTHPVRRNSTHDVERALERAGITTGNVTFHTLRHTALSRMIAAGHSDHTVMTISGHSTTRMLERYTHPTQTLKVSALETADYLATTTPQKPAARSEAVTDDPGCANC